MGDQSISPEVREARRTSQQIAEALIGEIRDGQIAIESPLPTERELCERFGASRPTVREALTQMQLRGYVSGGAGRRPRAAKPSLQGVLLSAADHIREILGDTESGAHLEQMRQFIETGAAREAAMHADNIQLTRLRDALDRNYESIGSEDFPKSDIAFHRALVSVIGNPVILMLHDLFVTAMISRRAPTDDPARYDRNSYDEHRAIYQAILDGDVVAATDVMDRHLSRSYRARLKSPRIKLGDT